MKKTLMMLIALVVCAAPLRASSITEALCADETFIAFVEETECMITHLKGLSKEEYKTFTATEAFATFRSTLATRTSYLINTYSLSQLEDYETVIRTAFDKVIKSKSVNAKLQKECGFEYFAATLACDMAFPCCPRYQPQQGYWEACQDLAFARFLSCEGLPQA
jgi:hypothetical protein